MKFDKPQSGEWVQPIRRGYKLMCCDCGLVHTLHFRHGVRRAGKFIPIKGGKIQFKIYRDNRSTGAARAAITKANRKK